MGHNIYFVITIDTEADHTVDWTKSRPLTFRSITESIPQKLEPLFEKYGGIPTYLLATEVLENESAMRTIKSFNQPHELGTHLHPEYIMPDKKFFQYEGTYSKEFSNNYPAEVEKEKIRSIKGLFTEKLGYAPRIYRGGKFGFSHDTARALAELGYWIDTSVTPCVSWENIGGPDFRACPPKPYFIDCQKTGDGLLEVPVSIGYVSPMERFLNKPTWLRPSFSGLGKIKKLIRNLTEPDKDGDFAVLNMMFHSMEFYPGASPYSKSEADIERLFGNVRDIIIYCKNLGAEFCGLSKIKEIYGRSRRVSALKGSSA